MENEPNSEPPGTASGTEIEESGIEYRIEDTAVRLLASLAAQEVEGVVSRAEEDGELGSMARRRLVGSVELLERPDTGVAATASANTGATAGTELRVTIAVHYGRNIAEVAREVQRRVAAALGTQASLAVGRVDVHVAEVVA